MLKVFFSVGATGEKQDMKHESPRPMRQRAGEQHPGFKRVLHIQRPRAEAEFSLLRL